MAGFMDVLQHPATWPIPPSASGALMDYINRPVPPTPVQQMPNRFPGWAAPAAEGFAGVNPQYAAPPPVAPPPAASVMAGPSTLELMTHIFGNAIKPAFTQAPAPTPSPVMGYDHPVVAASSPAVVGTPPAASPVAAGASFSPPPFTPYAMPQDNPAFHTPTMSLPSMPRMGVTPPPAPFPEPPPAPQTNAMLEVAPPAPAPAPPPPGLGYGRDQPAGPSPWAHAFGLGPIPNSVRNAFGMSLVPEPAPSVAPAPVGATPAAAPVPAPIAAMPPAAPVGPVGALASQVAGGDQYSPGHGWAPNSFQEAYAHGLIKSNRDLMAWLNYGRASPVEQATQARLGYVQQVFDGLIGRAREDLAGDPRALARRVGELRQQENDARVAVTGDLMKYIMGTTIYGNAMGANPAITGPQAPQ